MSAGRKPGLTSKELVAVVLLLASLPAGEVVCRLSPT
jgi:hypothetical protein